ncbi:MAG: hypothetical protein RSA55_07790, partial [Clostridia bacterium]
SAEYNALGAVFILYPFHGFRICEPVVSFLLPLEHCQARNANAPNDFNNIELPFVTWNVLEFFAIFAHSFCCAAHGIFNFRLRIVKEACCFFIKQFPVLQVKVSNELPILIILNQ